MLERGDVDRIILSRPAVEAGERLGFLPGDMREKVDPYLRPLYDALYDMMPADKVERGLTSGIIEVAPLAFMRGRTLANAVVILDEAQNTTSMQMKMFLTRLGENSKMIVTGDPTQIDLPPGQVSGLVEATDLLRASAGSPKIRFTAADVVRHPLVARIVEAYDARRPSRSRATRGHDRGRDAPRHRRPHPSNAGQSPPPALKPSAVGAPCARVDRRCVAAADRRRRPKSPSSSPTTPTIRALNRRFRGKDKATNVLSFPGRPPPGGDSARCSATSLLYETVEREGRGRGAWPSTTTLPI